MRFVPFGHGPHLLGVLAYLAAQSRQITNSHWYIFFCTFPGFIDIVNLNNRLYNLETVKNLTS